MKRLEGVPLKEFQNSDLFVRILAAEKRGLITVTINVSELVEETMELYQSKSFNGAVAIAWNKQRRLILHEALHKHMYPMLKAECRQRLEKESFERVARVAAIEFEKRVKVAGLNKDLWCWFEDKMVLVAKDGVFKEVHNCDVNWFFHDQWEKFGRKRKNLNKLLKKSGSCKMVFIPVYNFSVQSVLMKDGMQRAMKGWDVKLCDARVARSIGRTLEASAELSHFLPTINCEATRCAISLGRCVQNPLME